MAYNQFTIPRLTQRFGLSVTVQPALFVAAPPAELSDLLRQTLAANTRLALRSGSEKARSEYIIAPVLAEVYRQMQETVNLFSGVEFDVDPDQDLAGVCDFLFSLVPMSLAIEAPVISVVEAKKEDILRGIPQCLAELVAAQTFNANAHRKIDTLFGVVTTGEIWKFLRLQGTNAVVDGDEYFLIEIEKVVGIMLWMLRDAAQAATPTTPNAA
jgi:hypothetical protein